MPDRPVRVAIVNDYEIVVAGLAAALEPFQDKVRVVETDAQRPVISEVDIVLYDTFGQVQGDGVRVEGLVRDNAAKVVIFSWNVDPQLVDRAIRRGAAAYLSKALTADQLADSLVAIAGGKEIRPDHEDTIEGGVWPGRQFGLTARESEVLALITQGLSNQEIAELTYLSINSVKTYIRSAYRKIGVARRAQAVRWGMEHGFVPDRTRRLAGPLESQAPA